MELKRLGAKRIETNNLVLKKASREDLKIIFRLFNNKEICDYEDWKYYETFEYFENKVTIEDDLFDYNWIIYNKNEDTAIGIIGVHTIEENNFACEIGYSIHPSFHNKGYCTEALIAVSKFLINEVGFNRCVCKYRDNNIASKRVMEKAGYRYEGTERSAKYKNGKFLDVHIYSLLKIDL